MVEKAKLCRYKMYGDIHTPTSRTFVADHFPNTIISTPRETIGTPLYTAFGGGISRSFCMHFYYYSLTTQAEDSYTQFENKRIFRKTMRFFDKNKYYN
jgi:hypothetical protein